MKVEIVYQLGTYKDSESGISNYWIVQITKSKTSIISRIPIAKFEFAGGISSGNHFLTMNEAIKSNEFIMHHQDIIVL